MADLTVLFDGACGLCRKSVARARRLDSLARIEFLDLHDASVPERFPQIDKEAAMRWMQAVDSTSRVHSGIDAWERIGSLLPGWNVIACILRVPGVHWLAAKAYAWIARNRYRWNREACADASCAVHLPTGHPR